MIKLFFENLFNLFRKPATLSFPATPAEVAPNYRGLIEFNEEECIFCLRCENACPPGAIQFIRYEDGSEKYHYNPYLCIYCHDCVTSCPKPDEALWQSENLALGGVDPNISKDWYAIEKEAKESKKRYKKARRVSSKKDSE